MVGPDSILTQHSGVYFREMLGLGDLERLQAAFDRLDQDFCNLPAQHGEHSMLKTGQYYTYRSIKLYLVVMVKHVHPTMRSVYLF